MLSAFARSCAQGVAGGFTVMRKGFCFCFSFAEWLEWPCALVEVIAVFPSTCHINSNSPPFGGTSAFVHVHDCKSLEQSGKAIFGSLAVVAWSLEFFAFTIAQSELSHMVKSGPCSDHRIIISISSPVYPEFVSKISST